MDMLDRRILRSLTAVVKHGSIRAAAASLNTAPSVVSRQIADLESQLGVLVFERSIRGVDLTDAGRLVFEHIQRIDEDFGFLQDQIAQIKGIQQGRVRVICGEGFVPDLVSNGLRTFAAVYPQVRFLVQTAGTAEIIEAVREGDADIGIAYNPLADMKVRSLAIARQPLCAILPSDHAFSKHQSLTFLDCVDQPLALLSEGSGIRQLVRRMAADSGRVLVPIMETSSIEALRQFVAAGSGLTFLPRFAAAAEIVTGQVVVIELEDQSLKGATSHLLVRAKRRLPVSVDRLASQLARTMLAFAPETGLP